MNTTVIADSPVAMIPPSALGDAPETPFAWTGSPWSLVGPSLFNAAMTLLTCGIYNFWGRTEIRRRTWACVRLDGEPLVYHGTGLELFKGFLAASALILFPLFLLGIFLVIAFGEASAGWAFYQLALLFFVYPVLRSFATYRARRYRLARTSWRGVRGAVDGSAGEFAFLSWATTVLWAPTLGWIEPWRALYAQRFLIGDSWLGDRKLEMRGTSRALYGRFALFWLGALVLFSAAYAGIGSILGPEIETYATAADWAKIGSAQWVGVGAVVLTALLVWSLIGTFYTAALYNVAASTTVLQAPLGDTVDHSVRFKLSTKGTALFWLFLSNAIITYASVFVLKPVATARSIRYFVEHLALVGPFDPASIHRNPSAIVIEGEGLAQAFDFDAF